eukprot:5322709-Pleurochrysis_carterae.AAC.1
MVPLLPTLWYLQESPHEPLARAGRVWAGLGVSSRFGRDLSTSDDALARPRMRGGVGCVAFGLCCVWRLADCRPFRPLRV